MMTSYEERFDLSGLDDEDDLTDDEVFTRGGKSIPLEENGVNKPLMAPRQKSRSGDVLQTKIRKVPSFKVVWGPLVYSIVALSSVIAIICLVVFLINTFMAKLTGSLLKSSPPVTIVPCSNVSAQDVWFQSFPMFTTETAIRLSDLNHDGVDDPILGFGTGADAFYYPPVVCNVYFGGVKGCGGGILALDGKTGREIWRQYTPHEIFALNCNVDIDGDHVADCLGGGRMAGFVAVSGKDGRLLWVFDDAHAKISYSNVYTPQYVRDLDSDGIPDLVVIHGGDPLKEPGSAERAVGRILVVSGKSGQVLQWVEVPDKQESYYSPQILIHPDGTELVLFGTGGETHGGSLWYITLMDLLAGRITKARAIYTDKFKGIMTPPVLIDLTNDNVPDIVMAMFNSTVIAFDGLTFKKLWSAWFPSSESYSTPGVGFFNNDSVPDFVVNYQTGPGFPIYYYTQTTILDGKTGQQLLEEPIKMAVGTQSSPLAISVEGYGNDIFLYWVSDCHGSREHASLEFDFVKGTSIHEQTRADFCKLRFKESLFARLYAITSNSGPPGRIVYDSDAKKNIEFGNVVNYTAIGLSFLREHPEFWPDYYRYAQGGYPEDTIPESNIPYQEKAVPHSRGGDTTSKYSSEFEDESYQPRKSYNKHYSIRKQNGLHFQQQHPDPPMRYGPASFSEGDQPEEDYDFDDVDENPTQPQYGDYSGSQMWEANTGLQDYWEKTTGRWKSSSRRRKLKQGASQTPSQPDYQIWNAQLNSRRAIKHRAKRVKRHVGPHDNGGIQRTISTGTIAPVLDYSNPDNANSMDIVFASFWFYPAQTQTILPEDQKCIEDGLAKEEERFVPTNPTYGMDHDAYEEKVTQECLKKSGHLLNEQNGTYVNIGDYNPFDRPMGQMTVYRVRVTCHCNQKELGEGQRCPRVLPFEEQGWTSYMGLRGDGLYKPRQ